jgi:hypothetical protein
MEEVFLPTEYVKHANDWSYIRLLYVFNVCLVCLFVMHSCISCAPHNMYYVTCYYKTRSLFILAAFGTA